MSNTRAFFCAILVIFLLAISPKISQAFWPFGGFIVAEYSDEECNDAIVIVGVRGGVFLFTSGTIWYTLPPHPPVGVWTLGMATNPGYCSPILYGGASTL